MLVVGDPCSPRGMLFLVDGRSYFLSHAERERYNNTYGARDVVDDRYCLQLRAEVHSLLLIEEASRCYLSVA